MPAARTSIVVLSLVGFAGCAGSSPPTRLTAPQLISKAGTICQRAASSERAVAARSEPLPARLHQLARIGGNEVSELRSLLPPADESAAYSAFLGEGSRLVALVQRLSAAGGEEAAREILAEGRAAATRLEALEQPLGLSVCSIPTS
jgi:hypothetical protein